MKHIQIEKSDTKHSAVQRLSKPLQDRRAMQQHTAQLKGDRYYWVKPADGSWEYVGAFKNHAEANTWWASNKSSYPDGQFSQGSTKTKFK
ncbi:hypothetical protein [Pseudoalteromonas sp. R3]|uniref:hypothetical protein n=1 Tax=Pseudoalteromonas sp. R3 TaxID=1709477 RepID=UPI0006B5DC53|nr:hypothetical protein [Pseudoalteromonas sp. R3]AZZ98473.1 hypothetical protein ELR70_15950 [Pseudoalteromonas sp. R3]